MTKRGGGSVDPKLHQVHKGGPLHGEPVIHPDPVIDLGDYRAGGGMPLIARKRAEVMGQAKNSPALVAKFAVPGAAHGDLPGDVPSLGTPQTVGQRVPGGSALPIVSASRAVQSTEEQWTDLVNSGNVLAPPYDPWLLVCTVEESDALPPLIGAMVTNVTGFGFLVEPTFPKRDDEGEPLPPPDGADEQRASLELFLATAKIGEGGVLGCLQRVDRDKWETGNGYLEVLRNVDGYPAGLEQLPAWTMRLGKLSQPVLVELTVRHPTTGDLVTLRLWRRFRTFVQIREGRIAYFKEYGDPRWINWRTGEYSAEPWGQDANGNDLNGTEVVHRRHYAAHGPYGVPPWIGGIPHARSGRAAGELLVSWFRDAPIGVKLALIAGGTWNKDSYNRALSKIDAMARGKENAWKFVGLEADPQESGGDLMDDAGKPTPPRVGLEDLVAEIPTAIYQGDGNMIDGSFRRLGRMFRLPPVYYGAAEEHSRAAVNSARAVTEEQVMVPERELGWLQWFNSELLPDLGVFLWKIGLRGANTSDTTETTQAAEPVIKGGGASPNMLIRLWNEQTGQDAEPIAEPWGDRPWALTQTLIQAGLDPNLPLADVLGKPADQVGPDGQPVTGPDGQPITGPAGAGVVDDAQKTALNGAQVSAALEIVLEVVNGTITRPMAAAMLKAFFNLDDAAAEAILVDAERMAQEAEADAELEAEQAAQRLEQVPDVPDNMPPDQRERVQRRVLKAATAQRLASLARKVERQVEEANPGWFA